MEGLLWRLTPFKEEVINKNYKIENKGSPSLMVSLRVSVKL